MDLRPTYMHENRDESKPLRLNRRGTAKCSEEQLIEALTGTAHPAHAQMLMLQLEGLGLLDEQITKLNSLLAQAMTPHQDAVIRLAAVPGLGIDSAQQVIAEVGVTAATFPPRQSSLPGWGPVPAEKKAPKRTPAADRRKATNTQLTARNSGNESLHLNAR